MVGQMKNLCFSILLEVLLAVELGKLSAQKCWTTDWWQWPRQLSDFLQCGALRDGSREAMVERLAATCLHQCHPEKNCAKKKSERIREEELCAWRQTGTFQTRLHKFWVWQLISSSQSTCPDIRSCCTYSSTLGLTTLPHIYLSLSYPPDLFDLYLFIAIAAAACLSIDTKTRRRG